MTTQDNVVWLKANGRTRAPRQQEWLCRFGIHRDSEWVVFGRGNWVCVQECHCLGCGRIKRRSVDARRSQS